MAFYVYLLRNYEGRFYVGYTEDLEQRIQNHNRRDRILGKYTRKNGPWKLVWSERHLTRALAMAREREIKSWKSAKLIRQQLLGENALREVQDQSVRV